MPPAGPIVGLRRWRRLWARLDELTPSRRPRWAVASEGNSRKVVENGVAVGVAIDHVLGRHGELEVMGLRGQFDERVATGRRLPCRACEVHPVSLRCTHLGLSAAAQWRGVQLGLSLPRLTIRHGRCGIGRTDRRIPCSPWRSSLFRFECGAPSWTPRIVMRMVPIRSHRIAPLRTSVRGHRPCDPCDRPTPAPRQPPPE
jgi:hypothetical protein